MPKSTSRKKSSTVPVYNHTTRLIGCYVPQGKDAADQPRPPRHVGFKPGNNDDFPRDDLELCQANKAFVVNFSTQEVRGRTGKMIQRKNLEVGRTDELQADEEDALALRVEKAREAQAAEARD